MTGVRARLFGLVLLAALLASSTGFARVQFLCRMSGLVGRPCCCAVHGDKGEPGIAELRETDCCQAVVVRSADRAVFEVPSDVRVPPPAFAFLPDFVPPLASLARLDRPTTVRSRGPPPNGPPLYIKHCTLLG